ncbi:3'-5' exonuclease domain-containing protein [Aphelenchoides fujianensis]|nr:3'-5' exonuclease domain-containing protein [Aphelenchoides fujianensis]
MTTTTPGQKAEDAELDAFIAAAEADPTGQLEGANSHQLLEAFERLFKTKRYHDLPTFFKHETALRKFARFLNMNIEKDLRRIIAFSIINSGEKGKTNRTPEAEQQQYMGILFNLQAAWPHNEALQRMVRFLDAAMPFYYRQYFARRPEGPAEEPELAQRMINAVPSKQMLKFLHKLRQASGLDEAATPNAIFVRKMKDLYRVNEECKMQQGEQAEFFYQKIFHFLEDRAMHFPVLKFFSRDLRLAVYFAVFMDVAAEDLPPEMSNLDAGLWTEARERVEGEKTTAYEQYEEYKQGVTLCKSKQHGPHMVFLIDRPEELEEILFPFFEASDHFGFDAEWDQSYSGEVGNLALLQISSAQQTMLIDVTSFVKKHHFGREQWISFFSRIFAPKNFFYGFAVAGDLNVLLHNFPFLAETDVPTTSNFVCLHTILSNMQAEDDKAFAKLFNGRLPARLNLTEVSLPLLGFKPPKSEQLSVWSFRPLRKTQITYAALDSFLCFSIQGKMKSKLEQIEATNALAALSSTVEWPMERERHPSGDLDGRGPKNGKKTRASHFTNEELVQIIEHNNEKLQAEEAPTVRWDQRRYVADTMCSQLAAVLCRCGVEVHAGFESTKMNELGNVHADLRVLSCGKSVKNFPFGDRVLNIAASSSPLDVQLQQFLRMERMLLDPAQLNTRCTRCCSRWLVWLPAAILKYMHVKLAFDNTEQKGIDCQNYKPEDFEQAREELAAVRSAHPFANYFASMADGPNGPLYVAVNALVDLNRRTLLRMDNFRSIDGQGEIPITLATHLNYTTKEWPHGSIQAVCGTCGRQNAEAVVCEDPSRLVQWK